MKRDLLNFREFMRRAAEFLDPGVQPKPFGIPDDIPVRKGRPSRVFRIEQKGRKYEILTDGGPTWHCPTGHFRHLQRLGKAPAVGDLVEIDLHLDGTVKTYRVVRRASGRRP